MVPCQQLLLRDEASLGPFGCAARLAKATALRLLEK